MHKHRFLFLAAFIVLAALVRLTPWALADMGLTDAVLFERAFDKEVVDRAISGMGLTEAAQFAVVLWNASPLTALFLFVGARFTDRRWAYIAPLAAIFLSDIGIGLLRRDMSQGLHPGIPAIYGSYMVIVWLGTQVRKIHDDVSGVKLGRVERAPLPRWQAALISLAAAAGAGIAGEVVFFIVTNFATWVVQTGYYPHTAAGLVQCYAAGIPFFKHSVASTPVFAVALFGCSALVESWFPALKPNYVFATEPRQSAPA